MAPNLHVSPRTEIIYLDFSIKNAGFVFAVEICDLSVFAYNFYSIVVESSIVVGGLGTLIQTALSTKK